MRQACRQFVRFAAIGVIGTAAHYALLIALVRTNVAGPLLATTAGFALGALVNYALNYRYTFDSDKPHLDALPKFLAVALTGAALNYVIVRIGLHVFGLHYLLAQVISTAAILLWNFLANRHWTFRKRPERSERYAA